MNLTTWLRCSFTPPTHWPPFPDKSTDTGKDTKQDRIGQGMSEKVFHVQSMMTAAPPFCDHVKT